MNSALGRRVAFTIGALLVYRLGTYIPVPGVDPSALAPLFRQSASSLFGALDLFAGGGVRRLAIFALGIVPYISAAILVQLVTLFTPPLRALHRSGEAGRRKIVNYTVYLTLAMVLLQSYGLAQALEGVLGLVNEPGLMFRLSTMATLTGGTMFLVWLANQITLRGVGNGLALILLVGIVVEAPRALLDTIILGRQGVLSADAIAWLAALIAATVMLIVLMELARRRLPLEFPRRRIGGREIEGRSYLSLKLNGAGTIPVIFASWLLAVPLTIAAFGAGDGPAWWVAFTRHFGPGQLPYMAVYAALIVVCAYVYTAMILDPENAAADLKRYGGLVPGIEAGEATAAHIDHVLSRTTLVGALYLALICLIPEFLIWYMRVPFYFGGLSLLVVVCAILDLRAQIQGYVLVKLGS